MQSSPSVGEKYETREEFELDRVDGVLDGAFEELHGFVIECEIVSQRVGRVAIVVVELEGSDGT